MDPDTNPRVGGGREGFHEATFSVHNYIFNILEYKYKYSRVGMGFQLG